MAQCLRLILHTTVPNSARAFVSYSREDSGFVLRLCQDLRAAGAAIWLDKLDISPGEEWDQAVERGLSECRRILVVLSPNSVASQNVLDEVAFALAKKKSILPVHFQDCEVPYRLSRLQYVDFRTDYDSAFRELVAALRDTKDPRVAPVPKQSERNGGLSFGRWYAVAAATVVLISVVGLVAWKSLLPSERSNNTVTTQKEQSPPAQPAAAGTTVVPAPPLPNIETKPAKPPDPSLAPKPTFGESFRAVLLRYIAAAPAGFQAVGAQEFVDWTPSVVLPGATSCRGSGYPREPVIECVLYRTESEVEAVNKFEDLIELVDTSLPDWDGRRMNLYRAFFSSKSATSIIGLGVSRSGDRFDVEISVRPGSR